MWVENASSHNTIDSTLVRDTGAGGIRVGTGKPLRDAPDGSDYNTLVDNTVV